MIDITTKIAGSAHVLELKGKFRAHSEALFWKAVQESVVEQGARTLVLDFHGLEECDSYAISELLRVRASLLNMGGKLIIANVNELIGRVFHITKVDDIFEIRSSVAEALAELETQPIQ